MGSKRNIYTHWDNNTFFKCQIREAFRLVGGPIIERAGYESRLMEPVPLSELFFNSVAFFLLLLLFKYDEK